MTAVDLPAPLVGIVTLWATTFLYGLNVALFMVCTRALLQSRERGFDTATLILIGTVLQAIMSFINAATALGAGVSAFQKTIAGTVPELVTEWLSIFDIYTAVQQITFPINDFFGELILIWRLYVVYGGSFIVPAFPLLMALAALCINLFSTTYPLANPVKLITEGEGSATHLQAMATAGFVITASTQILVTLLLAGKIWYSGRTFSRGNYSSVGWMLVESGATLATCEIIFLAVWRSNLGGLAQFMLGVLGQVCSLVPLSIIVRVVLSRAHELSSAGIQGAEMSLKFRIPSSNRTRSAGRVDDSTTRFEASMLEHVNEGSSDSEVKV